VFDLLGERYQAALSQLASDRSRHGRRAFPGERTLSQAGATFTDLGAAGTRSTSRSRVRSATRPGTGEFIGTPADADDAVVRRLVDAAALPDSARAEAAAAILEVAGADAVVISSAARMTAHHRPRGAPTRPGRSARESALAGTALAHAPDHRTARRRQGRPARGARRPPAPARPPWRTPAADGGRRGPTGIRAWPRRWSGRARGRRGRDRAPARAACPGFVCAGAAMGRAGRSDQASAGNQLTVLITARAAPARRLVARAIHSGSPRADAMYLPYNCTTTTRDLADSQLFGHRRGSLPGPLRSAGPDSIGGRRHALPREIGNLPVDVQPKLLRFLEQARSCRRRTRRSRSTCGVLAATNADSNSASPRAAFARPVLPPQRDPDPRAPLRERRDEILISPATFSRAIDELNKPGRRAQPGRPRPVRPVHVARQRTPASGTS